MIVLLVPDLEPSPCCGLTMTQYGSYPLTLDSVMGLALVRDVSRYEDGRTLKCTRAVGPAFCHFLNDGVPYLAH